MGNVRTCLFIVLAACGSNSSKPDALVVHDAPADSKVFMDAPPPPPDAPAMYDFSCFGQSAPTTAPDPISISGTTEEITTNGLSGVGNVTVSAFKAGSGGAIGTATSATMGTVGAFTIDNLATGGVPLDGHLQAPLATYRTTYLFPANPLAANLAMAPVVMFSDQTFGLVSGVLGVTQDDTANGVAFVIVTDCSFMPITGATLSVTQGGTAVGDIHDLSSLSSMAAGTFAVFNVPDGPTQVGASYGGMTFPAHMVGVHKKPNGQGAEGTMTVTQVRPGP